MLHELILNRDLLFSEEVPEKWMEAPDIISLRSLDRKFVFPGNIFCSFCSSD